jgi:endonuclease YncB( thermonuclease family)
VAICYLGDLDLNGWLVSEGSALACRRYSLEFVAQEEATQAPRRGMWWGEFVAPWE